jgi:hypothetical protein
MIDEEVSRIISEQYERAKELLKKFAKEHNELADVLFNREVIFTEDVERIFGKRQWVSRTDEILAARQASEKALAEKNTDVSGAVVDVTALEVTTTSTGNVEPPASIPPIPSANDAADGENADAEAKKEGPNDGDASDAESSESEVDDTQSPESVGEHSTSPDDESDATRNDLNKE